MARKILYISHATKDAKLADAVATLLKSATSIAAEDLVSISLEEAGLPAGEDLVTHIEAKVGNPSSTIMLLTENYLGSRFCLCEMGAVWTMSQNIIPLIVEPIEARHLKKLLPADRLKKINDSDDLNKFIALVQEHLSLDDLNLARWAMEKKRFTSLLSSLR